MAVALTIFIFGRLEVTQNIINFNTHRITKCYFFAICTFVNFYT